MDQKSGKIFFVDTHAHLDFDKFDLDRDAVIKNARLANVAAIINIGINLETIKKSIALAESHDFIYATAGIHPHDANEMKSDQWDEFVELLKHPKIVAIGEIGLDYYRDYSPHDVQKKILHRQLELAVEHDLPVVVHTRNAWQDVLPIFAEQYRGKLKGVFHCFSGLESEAKAVLDAGYFISFTGVVTFKNANALNIAAHYVPLDRLLLETDCPFMAPEPFRGKRCEPAHVPYIAQKIAEARGIDVAELASQTNQNVEMLFGIKI
ncbi:TatD family hydrolase [candidate division KSB1 bacterium]|nr:TatD family hydrolase [candidate division KSB1 bacterium]